MSSTDHPPRPDLTAILAAARAATPGPWNVECRGKGTHPNMGQWDVESTQHNIANYCTFADSAHIATSNPATVEALCAYVLWLEERSRELIEDIRLAMSGELLLAADDDDVIDELHHRAAAFSEMLESMK